MTVWELLDHKHAVRGIPVSGLTVGLQLPHSEWMCSFINILIWPLQSVFLKHSCTVRFDCTLFILHFACKYMILWSRRSFSLSMSPHFPSFWKDPSTRCPGTLRLPSSWDQQTSPLQHGTCRCEPLRPMCPLQVLQTHMPCALSMKLILSIWIIQQQDLASLLSHCLYIATFLESFQENEFQDKIWVQF